MPQNKQREHKCSHHTAAAGGGSRWHNFHFSGKIIMCSVLFGLGLVLIGGIVMAIGMDRDDGSKYDNLNEIQNKAPMSIVGPVILGIGGFTVIVGIMMCLFETNICRKRQPDARPLIEEQEANSAASSTNPAAVPSTTQTRNKHRHHKKSSSPRKHKGSPKRSSPEDKAKPGTSSHLSPSSNPIAMQRSSSRDFTASDKFLTPPSSFINENAPWKPNLCDAENQTSTSLLKSFTSSGKSWTTSTEFQTPSSSFQDSSGSFEERKKNMEITPPLPNLEVPNKKQLDDSKHEFLSPKSSSAEILDDEPGNVENNVIDKSTALKKSDDDSSGSSLDEPIKKNLDVSHPEFITPKNSYVDEVSEMNKTLDNSSNSTLTNSQSQEDIEENTIPRSEVTVKSPVTSDDMVKVENIIINNHDSAENMNDISQVPTTGDSNLTINSELNSFAPLKDNLTDTSELPLNQHPSNTTPEMPHNTPTTVMTSQELNAGVQETKNYSPEDKKDNDIKLDLKDSSSNEENIASLQ